MIGLRASGLRATRFPRSQSTLRNIRLQSTSAPSVPKNSSSSSFSRDATIGGLVGGSFVFLGAYGWYHFSGAKTFVQTASQTKKYFDDTLKKTKESAPAPNQALSWLRDMATSYASVIPGGKGYVETVFKDLDLVHDKHREEVDKIVKDTYEELKDVSNKPFDAGSIAHAWDVLQRSIGKIAGLAKDAGGDILDNHPQLKEQFGGEFQKLKQMGDNYGPEAKKLVDQTWDKVQDSLKGGFSFDTVGKLKNVVQETTEKLQGIGDEAWQKAMEQAKPYLDKNPQIKELIEKNQTQLKQGNAMQLVQKAKQAFDSGTTGDLENYIKETVSKASGSGGGGGLEHYFNMIPGAGSIWSNLSRLQEGAQKHGKEAEQLLKEATEEIHQVLSKKVEEGKKLADKVASDTKK